MIRLALAFALVGHMALAQSTNTLPNVAPPAPPPLWQARGSLELRILDKVNARAVTWSGRVGQVYKIGVLTITARSCVVPPPDVPADSAAFLDIVDSRPASPSFHAWMFASAPSISMLEHPIYDVRLTQCR